MDGERDKLIRDAQELLAELPKARALAKGEGRYTTEDDFIASFFVSGLRLPVVFHSAIVRHMEIFRMQVATMGEAGMDRNDAERISYMATVAALLVIMGFRR